MKNKILSTAVATALALPTVALGAIDDQGMQYVTAAEGLHGSLRVDILYDTDEDGVDYSTQENSLRLWVNGTSDLGGGLQSTYYWEVRNGEAGDDENTVGTQAYDLGLRGGFGSVSFGYLTMVAFRMVPSASLAFERGSERESPGGDPIRNGARYESPVINGFQVGFSGVLNGGKSTTADPAGIAANGAVADLEAFTTDNDAGNPDGGLDQFSLAAKYTLPIGLEFGIGFESVDFDGYSDYITGTGNTIAGTAVKKDNATGFRAGVRYGQDNWLLGYEYRTYDGYLGFMDGSSLTSRGFTGTGAVADADDLAAALGRNPADVTVVSSTSTTTLAAGEYSVDLNGGFSNGDEDLEYEVHAVGAQVKVDRFTFSANYSTETDTIAASGDVKVLADISGGTAAAPVTDTVIVGLDSVDYEFTRDTIAIDAAYSLGSRSTIVLGWKNEDISSDASVFEAEESEVDQTYLFYRVDF